MVKSQETKQKMAQAWVDCQHESDAIETTRVEEIRHSQGAGSPSQISFKDAPVLIVVCGDRRTFQATVLGTHFIGGEGGPGATYLKGVANATQNMHLAAAALGLGSMWRSINRLWEQQLRTILGVPVVLEIHTVVAIGYPAYQPAAPYRRELQEMVDFEKYDMGKFRSGKEILKFLEKVLHHREGQSTSAAMSGPRGTKRERGDG